jgi:hypothetical protein
VVFPDDEAAQCGSVLFAGMHLPRQTASKSAAGGQ